MQTLPTNFSEQSGIKTGLYVDSNNLLMNGGYGIRFEVLRRFACRNGAMPMRLNAYMSHDTDRAGEDHEYRYKQGRFHATIRDYGFKVITKEVMWYEDKTTGHRTSKSNSDIDLAVDVLTQSENLDRVVLATGDGDFVKVVQALQNKGCRVEVVAFNNVSTSLRREADLYVSGYLVPELLPTSHEAGDQEWGEIGSRVRGVCYQHDSNKGFGWVRYLKSPESDPTAVDYRNAKSTYETIFCHDSEHPQNFDREKLTNRKTILEFEIAPGTEPNKPKAINVEIINAIT